MIEVFKKHPVQAELIKMQNDIQKLYKQAQKQGFADGEVRYSIDRNFSSELQEWFDNTTADERKVSGKRFLVGTTTEVLKSIGVKDYSIYFGGSKINKILSDNSSMSLDVIKQAVSLLEEPILIMKSLIASFFLVKFTQIVVNL